MLSPTSTQAALSLRLTEIYASIQGESTWAGLPCTFVRLARCNLRCRWCDTTYSFHGGEKVALDEILRQVEAYQIRLVEITGGEPLVQRECVDLCARLVERGFTVLVETSGSLPINTLHQDVVRIMDLKCPDSGACNSNHWPNIGYLNPLRDEVKFVLASRRDYEWSRDVVRAHALETRCKSVLFSCVFSEIEPRLIVEWILEDQLPVRFQLQMHKFIWPPNQKGV